MPTLSDQLKRFINTSRGTGRLDPAPEREAIGAAASQGLPTANEPSTGGGGGIASPLTEQSRVTTTVTVADISDPTFEIDFDVATQITFLDADGETVVINFATPP